MDIKRLPAGPVSDAGKYPRALTFKGLRSGSLSYTGQKQKPRRKSVMRKALARYYERRRLRKQRQNIEIIPNGDI